MRSAIERGSSGWRMRSDGLYTLLEVPRNDSAVLHL